MRGSLHIRALLRKRWRALFSCVALLTYVFLNTTNGMEGINSSSKVQAGDQPVLYASPDGHPRAVGTREDPVDLATGLSHVSQDTVLELLGGIYKVQNEDVLFMGGRGSGMNIIRAATGERPIVTRKNGFPPYVFLYDMTRVEGIWFGGVTDSVNTPFTMSSDDEVVGCVFWGYYGGINDASRHNLYDSNIFVGCGRGELYHPIYLSGSCDSWERCTTVRRNIFIGGEGWAIHLWHQPSYVRLVNNFTGKVQHALGSDGNPVIAQDNIFWSQATQPMILIRGDMTLTHNLVGGKHTYYEYRDPAAISVVADRNNFIEPASPGGPFGTHAVRWSEPSSMEYLGVSASALDSAVTELQYLFSQPASTILTDQSFASSIAAIHAAIDVWGDLISNTDSRDGNSQRPDAFQFRQNFPNPFNPATTFSFHLSQGARSSISISNMLGAVVATIDLGYLAAGDHVANWNSAGLPSGVYACTLRSGRYAKTILSVLLK
jgi:hypothetical protein